MKRYLAFQGNRYYPCGGMEDFAGDYDTQAEAQSAIISKIKEDMAYDTIEEELKYRWAHIWDSEIKEIIIYDLLNNLL